MPYFATDYLKFKNNLFDVVTNTYMKIGTFLRYVQTHFDDRIIKLAQISLLYHPLSVGYFQICKGPACHREKLD